MNSIESKLKEIPALPGIYKMLDASGNIIYIGKSKCLKNRVRSYFSGIPKQPKIQRMVTLISDIDIIVTDTHLEARLLECALIKSVKPHFNAQMKNDRRYFYLKLNRNPRGKPLSIVLERESDTFGPFQRKYFIESLMKALTHLYPLILQGHQVSFSYHTLPDILSPEAFEKNRQTLLSLLSDEDLLDSFIGDLRTAMQTEAGLCHFERATVYRDLMGVLSYLHRALHDYQTLLTKDFILKIPTEGGLKLFYLSLGRVVYKNTFNTLTKKRLTTFIEAGRKASRQTLPETDEKKTVDFLNILFSEIQTIPADQVMGPFDPD